MITKCQIALYFNINLFKNASERVKKNAFFIDIRGKLCTLSHLLLRKFIELGSDGILKKIH